MNDMLVQALKNLPDDVREKLKSAPEEKRKAFVENLSNQLNQKEQPRSKSMSESLGIPGLAIDAVTGRGKEGLEGLVKSAGADALGLVEGVTAGIPRGLIEKATGKDLSDYRGSLKGQIVGFTAGPGKLAGAVGKKVAGKVIPGSVKTGGRFLEGRGKIPYGSRVSEVIGKMTPDAIKAGAIEGGVGGLVGGALFPQEDSLDLKKKAYAALAGGIIGAPIGAITSGVGGFLTAKKLAKSAKRVGEKLDKINSRQPFEKTTAGEIFTTKDPKQFEQVQRARLEQTEKEVKSLLLGEVDEADTAIKDLIPKWERANYEVYGKGINDIAETMKKSGKSIRVSQLSDELNTYLKKRNLIGEPPFRQPATSPTDRALVKWADDLNKYRSSYEKGGASNSADNLQDAVLTIDDVMGRMRSIKNTVPDKILKGKTPMTPEYSGGREVDRILMKVLDDGSNAQLAQLNQRYAKFADLREFARAKFDINSEYVQKPGQDLLQKFAKNSGRSTVDLTLDRGTINKLEKLEKEVGVPFLTKLRKYGSSFEALEDNVRLLEEKAARTGVMVDVIKTRNQEAIRGILDKLKVPETIAQQMATAAYAYMLARTLGGIIGRDD